MYGDELNELQSVTPASSTVICLHIVNKQALYVPYTIHLTIGCRMLAIRGATGLPLFPGASLVAAIRNSPFCILSREFERS